MNVNQAISSVANPEAAANAYRLRGGMMPLHGTLASEAQITKKAEEFESMFLSQMFQHMFDGIETNELFGGGEGEDAYKSLLIDEYADMVTKTGGIGVADYVKAEMIRMQDVQVQAAHQRSQIAASV